jgi:phosphohistidine phosphatase
MSKQLYLLRHAASVDKHIREHDKERELSVTGIKEAMQMGSFLARNSPVIDRIFSSSAVRTKATTQLVSDIIHFDPDKINFEDDLYDATVRTFFRFVTDLDDDLKSVMCVGHNPTVSYLAEYLTGAELSDMATCGLAIIKFNCNKWSEVEQGSGELVSYTYPAMLPM